MKKIYSLVMALVMVLSATAMPMLSKADAGKTLEAAKLVSKKDFKKQMREAKPMHKAPAATNAVYNIECTSYHAEDYTASDGDWYITMQGNGIIFNFDIYTTTLESGKTYTFDDMEPYYTAAGNADATDATFKVTFDTDGLAHVVAMMVAGGNTYNLTFDEQPKVEHTWGAWADFAPKGVATGDYTHTILFSTPQTVNELDVQVRYATDEPTLAQVKVSNWGAGPLSAYGRDFIFEWNTANNTCVVPEQGTGYYYQSYGEVKIADVSVWQGVDYYNIFPCTYNPATATFSLSVSYYIPGAGGFGYSGDNKGNTAETLVMNSPAATVTGDTIRYTMEMNAKWVDYAASQGWFQLYQSDGHYNVSISTGNDPRTEGEFFKADLDASYTYIGIDGTKLTASDLHAVVSKSGDVVTGTLWVTDKESGNVYEATLTYDPSKPLGLDYDMYEGVEMTFATSDITANSASGTTKKTINFQAVNADDEVIALTLYASSTDADITIPEGEYTFATTKAAGTALISTGVSSTGSVARSYLATKDEEGYLEDMWFLVEGKVTVKKVTVAGAPAIYLVLEGKNSWGFYVKATVGEDPTPTAISNTAVEGKAVKMVKDGQLVILKNGKYYSIIGAEL